MILSLMEEIQKHCSSNEKIIKLIPIEFFKTFFSKSDLSYNQDASSNVHYSDCAKCLLSLFNKIWDGDFPEEWNFGFYNINSKKRIFQITIIILVFLFINVGIKIILKIVTNRISRYALDHKFV